VPMTARQIVSDLVDEALLAVEARRLGVNRTPSVLARIEEQRRQLAADAFVAKLGEDAKPTDAELRAMYHSTGDAVRLVLLKVTSEAEARAALARVRAGGDLSDEARRGADPELARSGGDTGWAIRAALDPTLATAVFAANPGDLVGPLQLGLGWAVARVVDKRIGDEAGFAERKDALLAHARRQFAQQAKAHIIERLRRKAAATVDEAFLRSVDPRREPTAEELAHPIATIDGVPLPYSTVHAAVARLLAASRHGSGAGLRIELARREVDDRILKNEAIRQGFGRTPAVVAAMASIERNLAARAAAEKLGRSADLADPAVASRLKDLRASASVRIDRDKVAALERAR
jgi:peptidyl-prolyl cis-trans isomerase C